MTLVETQQICLDAIDMKCTCNYINKINNICPKFSFTNPNFIIQLCFEVQFLKNHVISNFVLNNYATHNDLMNGYTNGTCQHFNKLND